MLQAIILGLVQGLTEFLPVSSSGHLVLVPALLGWRQPSLTFDVLLHLGTLLALVVYFRADLGRLAGAPFRRDAVADRRLLAYLAIASVPAGVAGLALGGVSDRLFEAPLRVCGELVVTALILLGTERWGERARRRPLTPPGALTIGVAQAIAILPGISRSGSTIGTALLLGLSREEATRFSFLLAIPAIAGAGVVRAGDLASGSFELTGAVAAGVIASAVSSYAAIGGLLAFVRSRSLRVFAGYLLVFAPLSFLILVLR